MTLWAQPLNLQGRRFKKGGNAHGDKEESREEEKEKIASLQGFRLTLFTPWYGLRESCSQRPFAFVPNAPHNTFFRYRRNSLPWSEERLQIWLQVPFVGCIGKFGISTFG